MIVLVQQPAERAAAVVAVAVAVAEINNIDHARITLKFVREKTSSIILFYSGGKDSIVLLDMLSSLFDEIHCVFMYFVDDLDHQNPILVYPKKYGEKVHIHKMPHWMLTHYFKNSYLRFHRTSDDDIKLLTLKDIENFARKNYGIDWIINGAKQSDSLHRSLMLRRLKFASINEKSKRAYPLSSWSKQDVLTYIRINRLMLPEVYGPGKSNGLDLTEDVLVYLRDKFPSDYQKILKVFPFASKIVYQHDTKPVEVSEVRDGKD